MTLPAVRHVGLNSMRRRRQRAMALYTTVYVGVWALFGVTALGLAHLATVARRARATPCCSRSPSRAAAVWQLTRTKRRALFACGRTVPLPPLGRRADAGCARFALLQAWRCIRSCWAIMAVMVAVGHSSLAWMVALTALVVAEELTVRGRRLPGGRRRALAGRRGRARRLAACVQSRAAWRAKLESRHAQYHGPEVARMQSGCVARPLSH